MKSFVQKYHRLLFYSTWFLSGLYLSYVTELWDDEAYYWLYAKFLDWGYFDHPPMIAVAVKAGYFIFQNELGVRLVPLLMNVGTLFIIEKLLKKKDPVVFYAIGFSLGALQVAGFLAVPDTPLLFFTALFFYCYKIFLEKESLLNTVWLGIVASLLLYSKYHGVLVVFFTLLSNPKLFIRYKTYIAGLIATICFAPHLYWQWQHDWVSFRYHLTENNFDPYQISFTIDYIVGQLLLVGPIAGFILLPAAFLYKSKDKLEKALQYSMYGFYGFFLLSSFKGWVEANWTAPVLIAFVVLSHNYLLDSVKWRKVLYYTLPFSVILFIVARFFMVVDILPQKELKKRFHAWKNWPEQLKEKTKNSNIVFLNSYQFASKYWFYTGQPSYSMNDINRRQNNFNFWPIEDSLIGKPAYVVGINELLGATDSLRAEIELLKFRYEPVFLSYAKIEIKPSSYQLTCRSAEKLSLFISADIPSHYLNVLSENPDADAEIILSVSQKNNWIKNISTTTTLRQLLAGKNLLLTATHGLPAGIYNVYIGFIFDKGFTNRNSLKITLTIL